MAGPFEPGERVLLVDAKERRYLVLLRPGATFHFHGGMVAHDDLLGRDEGSEVRSSGGARLRCFRPTLAEFVLKMPRGAQVVYPKDVGAILVHADVAPGTRILEAGTGSGSLTMALCRATGPEGRVVSYEVREDFHRTATGNLETFFGKLPAWLDLRLGDVADVPAGQAFDRAVLDLPEPWAVLGAVRAALAPGGLLCVYLPTTNQTQQAVLAMREAGFLQVATLEVLARTWHVEARSVRPDHRMVAHTAFLTFARRGPDAPGAPDPPDPPGAG